MLPNAMVYDRPASISVAVGVGKRKELTASISLMSLGFSVTRARTNDG